LKLLNETDLSHVPYLVLLFIYLNEWKYTHSWLLPSTYDERKQFKEVISNGRKLLNDDEAENFDEALGAVWRISQKAQVPDNVMKLLQHEKVKVTADSSNFWILVAALADYLKLPRSNNLLPLSGTIPDMKANTASFVQLQTLYRAKARKDFALLKSIYIEILENFDRAGTISDEEGEAFCKNAKYIVLQEGSVVEYCVSEDSAVLDCKSPHIFVPWVGKFCLY
jgi:amyloid beta precursor protein binding protein 1